MNTTRHLIGVILVSGFAALTDGKAAAASPGPMLVLAEDGVALAPLILTDDAPPFTRRAAEELAGYIEKISDARPVILEGVPDPVPERAVWIGYQPLLRELFPDVDFEFQHPEEILITVAGNHVAITGRDRWDPEHLEVPDRRGRPMVGKQQEYGTVNAVYTFLQDFLDVRWLWPGELGEDVPRRTTLALEPVIYRYHPRIRARGGLFSFSMLGNRGYGRSHDWSRLQRIQLGSLEIGGGHAFSSWWQRFHKDHPDFFALQPDGTRSGWPGPRTVKLCHANPAVWERWLEDVAEQLERDPNQTVFNASPNDGWSSGHCICENCLAWDHPDGEIRSFGWQGLSQNYVALSDRDVTFANHCARLLRRRYPDEDYYVLMMAYGHSRPAPVAVVPDDNVIISSVANFLGRTGLTDRGSSRDTTHRDQFAAWGQIAPHIMWRPNTGSPAGWQQGQPDIYIAQAIEDFKFVAENNCIGIFVDSVWEHWATQGPQYYIMAQLVWNPDIDAMAVMDDYYRRAFGPAVEELRDYWALLEDKRAVFVDGDRPYHEVYDADFFRTAYGMLDRGMQRLADAPEIYGQRIAFVRAGLDYTRLIIEIRQLMAQVRASRGKDSAAADKARANWEQIERIGQEYVYAINWGPLRPQTPRMSALHPDYYNK